MKRFFITGVAGFIGMHLALALKKRGDFVTGCDNFNAYYDPSLKTARASLLSEQGIAVISCDVVDREVIKEALASCEITHVVHLAAQAGVRHSLSYPEAYVHSNLNGFVQLLEALRCFPDIPLTYASSSSVYGLNAKLPFSESDPTEQPASLYGATKKSNELLAKTYHHLYGIRATGLRYFTVYGPWGRPDMAYYSFAKALIKGDPIPVFGEGKLMRDFTYIDDIIQGTIAAIDLCPKSEIFNLGNHHPHSVLDLIHTLENLLGKKASLKFLPPVPGDVTSTFADISKSQRTLSFFPKTSLSEGLAEFTRWFLWKEMNHRD